MVEIFPSHFFVLHFHIMWIVHCTVVLWWLDFIRSTGIFTVSTINWKKQTKQNEIKMNRYHHLLLHDLLWLQRIFIYERFQSILYIIPWKLGMGFLQSFFSQDKQELFQLGHIRFSSLLSRHQKYISFSLFSFFFQFIYFLGILTAHISSNYCG